LPFQLTYIHSVARKNNIITAIKLFFSFFKIILDKILDKRILEELDFEHLSFSYGCEMGNKSQYLAAYEKTPQQFMDNPIIHWEAILWIQRPTALWIIEIIFAMISLSETLLLAYLSYKVRKAI